MTLSKGCHVFLEACAGFEMASFVGFDMAAWALAGFGTAALVDLASVGFGTAAWVPAGPGTAAWADLASAGLELVAWAAYSAAGLVLAVQVAWALLGFGWEAPADSLRASRDFHFLPLT